MGDGGEVEPGEDGEADDVGVGVTFDVGALADAVEFGSGLLYEVSQVGVEGVEAEADGAVGASYGAAAVDTVVAVDGVVDDAGFEVF